MSFVRKLNALGVSLMLGLSMALTSATGAWAQDGIIRRDLRNFHEFLEHHPRVAEQLRDDPSLANDRRWVSRHDDLEDFLRNNPRIREQLRENPRRFMSWERKHLNSRYDYGRYGYGWRGDVSRWDLRRFDQFLDSHPRIAERLSRNPDLINNRQFVEDHYELREFLRRNPDIRREVQVRPHAFMERTDRYDRLSRYDR
jgi:hypothetical protein